MNSAQLRLLVILTASCFFIVGFIFSFVYYPPVFARSAEITITLQNNITSPAFKAFMNIVSNLFNPVVCAGYILVLYLMTARKLEVIAFLIWFLFLSWMISLLKQVYQQPRPFWVNSEIQMLEWTCYTEYGSPSGHSALVIVLLDFLVRFAGRWSPKIKKLEYVLYFLSFSMQLLVMFSRLYLGMHSLNQIMLGFMLGAFSMIPYYLYVEKFLFSFCIRFLTEGSKALNFAFVLLGSILIALQQTLMTYLPTYQPPDDPTNPWIMNISNRESCSGYNYSTSFFFRCFQDESIAFGIPALLLSLSVTTNGHSLLKKLAFQKCSLKFWAYIGVIVAVSLVPVAIFLNPLWKKIHSPQLPVIIWITHSLGFIFGIVCMVGLSPYIQRKFDLDKHQHQSYYQQFFSEYVKTDFIQDNTIELSGLGY